jgi:hypothetical protein
MSRRLAVGAGALALVVLVFVVLLLSGGDDGSTTASPPPSTGAPGDAAPPSGDLGALPPGFVECMAQEGYEIQSSADIHSAPPEVLQACFGASHSGG